MFKKLALSFMGICAAMAATAHAETFVILSDGSDHEAVISTSLDVISSVTSNVVESLPQSSNAAVESKRLIGDVTITLKGTKGPILIKADKVILRLLANETSERGNATTQKKDGPLRVNSTAVTMVDPHTQLFTGDVFFEGNTPSGPFRITADKLTYQADSGT
jgi:lipopolysaccharide export system protein LptA